MNDYNAICNQSFIGGSDPRYGNNAAVQQSAADMLKHADAAWEVRPRGLLLSHCDTLSEFISRAEKVGCRLGDTADRLIGADPRTGPECGSQSNSADLKGPITPDVIEMGRLLCVLGTRLAQIEAGANRLAGL